LLWYCHFVRLSNVFQWMPVLILCSSVLVAGDGKDSTPVAQAEQAQLPAGIVSFFATDACPPGWTSVEQAEGRVIIGATQSADVGERLGEPVTGSGLTSHVHTYDFTTVFQPQSHLAGQGVLRTVAPGTEVHYSGRSTPSSMELPFLHAPACRPLLP